MLEGVRKRLARHLELEPAPALEPNRSAFHQLLCDVVGSARSINRVALLPLDEDPPVLGWMSELAPDAEIHVYGPDLPSSDLHVQMAAVGPFDLIVDTSSGRGRYARAQELLMRSAPGGMVVIRSLPGRVRKRAKRKRSGNDRRDLARLLGGEGHATVAKLYPDPGKLVDDSERLAHVVDSVNLVGGHVVARCRQAVR